MFKASVKMLFMRQASALQSARLSSRPNTGQQRNVGRFFSKMPQGCDETRWFTDSGVDAF